MKIRLLSDLHLEFRDIPNIYDKEADVLVIAGDLNVGVTNTAKSLIKFAKNYEHVVYVMGNHECYDGSSINEFDINLKSRLPGNVHFLNPGYTTINDVTFIGAALWTNFRKDWQSELVCSSAINDFYKIKNFKPKDCTELHSTHIKFIKDAYNSIEGKKVIVTHFLPAIECIDPMYRGEGRINHYFANDYKDYIESLSNTTWLFGHTHSNVDIKLGDTRLIANPYGYTLSLNYREMIIDI